MIKIALILLQVYIIVCVAIYFLQDHLLFHPDDRPFALTPNLERSGFAAVAGTRDEKRVRYYLHEAADSRIAVVVFHGNAGGAADRLYLVEPLLESGIHLALVEYPGYAGDDESPGQAAFLRNAEAVLQHLRARLGADTRFVLFGESLGTGVCLHLATHSAQIAGLVLIAPYASIASVAAGIYPWLPVRLLIRNPFPASEWARSVTAPTLAIHGRNDTIIPYESGEKLFAAIKAANKTWIAVEHAGHNDVILKMGREYDNKLRAWLKNNIPAHAPQDSSGTPHR